MPERWPQVERIYSAVVARPESEWATVLAELCAGDDSLRQEVESLLEHENAATRFLETPAFAGADVTGHLATERLLVGQRFGSYTVLAPIGSGGMGEVYRALDERLGRQVAIKLLPSHLANDPDRRTRLEREARTLAALNHPHIGAIYGLEDVNGCPALVLELVEGETLAEHVAGGLLPVAQALAIARQIADALAAAHERGIIHRDLKPANIKITPDGIVKVLDFGIAKFRAGVSGSSAGPDALPGRRQAGTALDTHTSLILGTPRYMSPEQAAGRAADTRCDLWAFGVVLLEMLTGRAVFTGKTEAEVLESVLKTDLDLTGLLDGSPASIQRLLRRCLERDRGRRLDSAAVARLEIDDALALPAAKTLPPAASSSRRVRLTVALAGVAVLVTVVSIGGFWFGRIRVPEESGSWSAFTQLTDAAGEETAPSLAPDGASFAYASRHRGSWDIYVQRVGGRTTIPVAASPERDESWPAFSPDGQRIAFSESDSDGGIFVVGATGESVNRLTDFGFNPTWSPEGDRIAFAAEELGNPYARSLGASALWVVGARGGVPTKLYDGDAMQPSWSPSGARIAFWQAVGGQRDLATIPADGRVATVLLNDAPLDWSPTWSPDGRYMYFSSDRGGSMGMWRLAVDERTGRSLGVPELIGGSTDASIALASFSRDGRSLLFRSQIFSIIPVAVPFDPATERAGQPRDIIRGSGFLSPTSVSPDGQWLAVGTAGAPQEDIILLRADGSELRRLTDDTARDRIPRFTPDGTALVFYSNREGAYGAWSIATDGSGLTPLTTKSDDEVIYPVFAPSATMLLAQTWRSRQAFLLRSPWPVTISSSKPLSGLTLRPGQLLPTMWSPDDRWLSGPITASSGAAVGFGVYEIATGVARSVSEDSGLFVASWLPDSRRLIYVTLKGELVVVDAMSGARRVVLSGLAPSDLDTGAMAPDGRTFYYGAVHVESNIWRLQRK
jgi:serine/threonine protein kinase